ISQLVADLDLDNPEAALNVFDFEAVARRMLVPAHYGYMASGVDDDVTLRANRLGFEKYRLRPRRLVDVSEATTRTTLFGETWEAPILLCPVGGLGMFNPEGAVTVARAARSRNMTQILSSAANAPVETVNEARGAPIWFQLYARPEWTDTRPIVERAQAAGCQVLVWTVDLLPGRNMETDLRARALHLGFRRTLARRHRHENPDQGHRNVRGRAALRGAWRRRCHRFEPRRPRDRNGARDDRVAVGGRGR